MPKSFEPALEGYTEEGKASWYGADFDGRATSSGEIFDMKKMTAAHKTLPFGTMVEVTDLATSKTVTVRINDRGPFVKGRIIDLSRGAAQELGVGGRGVFEVKIATVRTDSPSIGPVAPSTAPVKRDALGRIIAEADKSAPAETGDAPLDPMPPTGSTH